MSKVAIIDSGVDFFHKELATVSRQVGYSFLPAKDGVLESECCVDDNGHGTAIAGIINSHAPRATLLPIKVLDGQLRSRGDALAKAIYWAADQGADIINISADSDGKRFRDELEKAIKYASNKGALIISSYGRFRDKSVPACLKNVISVDSAFLANPNKYITCMAGNPDFSAPGGQQVVLHLNGGYNFGGGSSYAAAHISGKAAATMAETNLKGANLLLLLKQKGIKENSNEARKLLSSSQPVALVPDENIIKKNAEFFSIILEEIQKCSNVPIELTTNLLQPDVMRRSEVWLAVLAIGKRLKINMPKEDIGAHFLITPYNLGYLVLKRMSSLIS